MNNLLLWLELRRWRAAGRTARLWWRDDDASGLATTLDRLLLDRLVQLATTTRTPLTLAVVPVGEMSGLAARLQGAELVSVSQHGVDHQNRREGAAAGEFPHDCSQRDVEEALAAGWSRLEKVPGALKVFVPPWNDVHPRLERALGAGGYAGWSAGGLLSASGTCPRLDIHLDMMRWRGGSRFRGRGRLLAALTTELRRRRRAGLWEAPIGLLSHHLVHDTAAWTFLGDFLRWSKSQPELSWVSLPELLAETQTRRAKALRRSATRLVSDMALAHPA
ncbi:polysaccharide deacetylase [Phenylobacterium sp.]|uniref:polysaccharide deacetylase n=1 Tax=Phenylobacterium sp. TaxID=1871053 RepID=UPI00121C0A37|nr:polysaccharide deacetylase [Phenylobacterium sp.]THD71170.1 MAG: polysaccharide deacetylase [Phenylobacterium sp.]